MKTFIKYLFLFCYGHSPKKSIDFAYLIGLIWLLPSQILATPTTILTNWVLEKIDLGHWMKYYRAFCHGSFLALFILTVVFGISDEFLPGWITIFKTIYLYYYILIPSTLFSLLFLATRKWIQRFNPLENKYNKDEEENNFLK